MKIYEITANGTIEVPFKEFIRCLSGAERNLYNSYLDMLRKGHHVRTKQRRTFEAKPDEVNNLPWDPQHVRSNFKKLGEYVNFYRGRRVLVFEHPTRKEQVITLGYAIRPEYTSCHAIEPRSEFAKRIEFNDWSDHH